MEVKIALRKPGQLLGVSYELIRAHDVFMRQMEAAWFMIGAGGDLDAQDHNQTNTAAHEAGDREEPKGDQYYRRV